MYLTGRNIEWFTVCVKKSLWFALFCYLPVPEKIIFTIIIITFLAASSRGVAASNTIIVVQLHSAPQEQMRSQLSLLTFLLTISVAMFAMISTIAVPKIGKPITLKNYRIFPKSWEEWYKITTTTTTTSISSEQRLSICARELSVTFLQSSQDQFLNNFLNAAEEATKSNFGRISMYFKQQAYWCLQRYMGWSQPDSSGFLSKASLYVASEQQLQALLQRTKYTGRGREKATETEIEIAKENLLDVGSGTGTETKKLRNVLDVRMNEDVTCLENSISRKKILISHGFKTATSFDQLPGTTLFTHASLLNVLDRCDSPHDLLSLTIQKLTKNGILIIGTVLPFRGKVYVGKRWTKWGRTASRQPTSPFDVRVVPTGIAGTFEDRLVMFLDAIYRHHPTLKLRQWTKLPYVSSGDTYYTHYTIDMALMVFQIQPSDSSLSVAEFPPTTKLPPPTTKLPPPTTKLPPMPKVCQGKVGDQIYHWLSNTLLDHQQEKSSWGDVLDAGAGFNSMCWLMRQDYDSITEVTATTKGRYGSKGLREAVSEYSDRVRIVLGNWQNNNFFPSEKKFDVVVADYLLGATELHWAYGADTMMDHLLHFVKPGGYLLIVGLEPYETILDRNLPQDQLVLEIEAIGDAAALLAGESTYRELPEHWVNQQVTRTKGLYNIVASKQFEMKLTVTSMRSQIGYAKRTLKKIKNEKLQTAYLERVRELEEELKKSWTTNHQRGRNYAMVIQRNVV